MTEFTPWLSLGGGALIGLAAVLLMASLGRFAGVTGILAGVIPRLARDLDWRIAFLLGMVLMPWVLTSLGARFDIDVTVSRNAVALGGFLVGVGVTLGSGCTSGHAVCGLARGSTRSLAATLTFMLMAGVTVYVVRHVLAG